MMLDTLRAFWRDPFGIQAQNDLYLKLLLIAVEDLRRRREERERAQFFRDRMIS